VLYGEPTIYDGTIKDTTEPVWLGKTIYSGREFNGLIDDVRIYNYARTPDEIRLDYNNGYAIRFGGSPADYMTRGLVGYWNFDEGSGATSTDGSDYGNDGTLINGPAWTAGAPAPGGGTQGTALDFDGVDDYVDVGTDSSLDNPTQFTVEKWIKPNTGYGELYPRIIQATGQFAFCISTGGFLRYHIYPTVGGDPDVASTIIIPVGEWTHVAATWDNEQLKLYINGEFNNSLTQAGPLNAFTGPLAIGGTTDQLRQFNGLIDEVRIYNRALSAEEVRYHYNRGGPVAHWKFDEGAGDTAFDSSENNNDGSISGATWVRPIRHSPLL
jgi:hypothetical protein